MGLLCLLKDGRLSRYVDGELSLDEYRRLQGHVRRCPRCAARAAAFRDVDRLVGLSGELGALTLAPAGLALSLTLAAALVASLGLNLWLPREPAPALELAGLTLPQAPSEALTAFHARLAQPGRAR